MLFRDLEAFKGIRRYRLRQNKIVLVYRRVVCRLRTKICRCIKQIFPQFKDITIVDLTSDNIETKSILYVIRGRFMDLCSRLVRVFRSELESCLV